MDDLVIDFNGSNEKYPFIYQICNMACFFRYGYILSKNSRNARAMKPDYGYGPVTTHFIIPMMKSLRVYVIIVYTNKQVKLVILIKTGEI